MTIQKLRGFAAMSPEKHREIAAMGGASVPAESRSFSAVPGLAGAAGRKGGKLSGGNFKNCPERAIEAGRKGGQNSPTNFKNSPDRASAAGRKQRSA